MKRAFRKTIFFCLVILVTFSLVASTGTYRRQLAISAQKSQSNDCVTVIDSSATDSLGTDSLITNSSKQSIKKNCMTVMQTVISPNNSVNTSPSPITTQISRSPIVPDQNLAETERFLSAVATKLPTIPEDNTYERIILGAYGAVFLNYEPGVTLPPKVKFDSAEETKKFQDTLTLGKVTNTNNCYLQKVAADALNKAISQVRIPLKSGFSGDCTRDFATNLRFWNKYANNNTLEQVRQGKEKRILGIVAPPGTSQHLWGLAIDLRVTSQTQRKALQENGWFQTVENDDPHWTYMGLAEEYLPQFGFQKKVLRGITYWLTPLQMNS
ncbi:MAG: D-alanyl-D-alanine carboxypeptidase family protein [Scytonematopsis contorta HA4267-MV1]|jgi:hypothetical protein|nr:D-alanyl-D-alanine carboxypeptidase family protein [Scytonematopsis contorta HA4267-MV1]